MASTANLTTDLPDLLQQYFERRALKERMFNNGLLKDAKRSEIPKFFDKHANFHKWAKFALPEDVSETGEPSLIAASVTEVTASLIEYASAISIPNFAEAQFLDSLMKEAYPKFAEQAERGANARLRAAIAAGSEATIGVGSGASFSALPVIYANGKNSFANLEAGDRISNKDIQNAVSRLEQLGAPKFPGGYYKCLLNPWAKQDLMANDADFRNLIRVGALDILKKNEMGMWAGAMIGQEDEPFRETLGGTENTYVRTGGVNSVYVYGPECFGVTQLMGKTGVRPRYKVQDITVTGSVTTIGYRIPFAAIVLDPTFGVVIKSVQSDNTVPNAA